MLQLMADDAGWLDELQRLVDAVRSLKTEGVVLDADVVQDIDGHLIAELLKATGSARKFRGAWQSARLRLSDASPIGRLVHWLDGGAPKSSGGHGFDFGWRAPEITPTDVDAVLKLDPAGQVIRAFVAYMLPETTDNYDAPVLLPWLKSFGLDLTDAFLQACATVASDIQFLMSANTVSEGALAGEHPPYDKVWAEIMKLDDAVDADLTRKREDRRAAWQGELDFVAQLHIQEDAEDAGSAPAHFAKGYVYARRRREGYHWIQAHPRPELVLPLWAEAMMETSSGVTKAELEAYFTAVTSDDRLEARGLRNIGEQRLAFGRDRLMTALLMGTPDSRSAALTSLYWLEGEERAEAAVLAVLGQLEPVAASGLAPMVVKRRSKKEEKVAMADRVLNAASADARPAVMLALSNILQADDDTLIQHFRALTNSAVADLIENGPRPLARLLLVIAAAEGRDIRSAALAWLESNDETDAQSALAALAKVNSAEARKAIVAGLSHRDYEVRRRALDVLAPQAMAAERGLILKLAAD